jgi:copper transport protein
MAPLKAAMIPVIMARYRTYHVDHVSQYMIEADGCLEADGGLDAGGSLGDDGRDAGRHDCRVTAARRPRSLAPDLLIRSRSSRVRVRRARTVLLAIMLGLLSIVAGPAAPASAHAALVGTSPAADSVVQQAPTQVVLTFTEVVNPVAGKVRVIAPDGTRIDRDDARSSGLQLIIPLEPVDAVGTYLVTYRVISADSHPIGGAFAFSYKSPSPGGPPSAAGGGAEASTAILAALPVVRWIGYVGLLLLVGAVLVLALLWPQRLSRSGPIRVIWLGAGMVALATVLELVLQVPYVAGGGLGNITGSDVREVLASQYGAAHLIRLGVLGAALVLVRPIVQAKGWGADRVLLAVLGTIGVATWSVSGHPSASPVPTVTVVSDMIHIASMSVWLGGLVMLAVFLLPRANATELGAIVPVWSRWATYAVGALVLTGTAQALIEIGTPSALFSTTYGLLIVAKVAVVAVVLLVAALSHRMVGAVADEADHSARRLRRIVIIEAAVAAAILGITSVLVQITPARTSAGAANYATVQTAVMQHSRFTLTVDLTPATVGANQVHMYAATPDGQPATILQWTVKASLLERGIEPIEATVLKISPEHATGQVVLPAAGTWKFTFELLITEDTNGIVTADFIVKN